MGTIIEILVDLSNSMGSYNDGKYLLEDKSTRMSAQKKILINEILPTIDYASTVTIRTFYSKKINETETLIANIKYHGPGHLRSMQKVISQLPDDPQKTGGTPITDAIILSIKELSKKNSFDKKIILVTDGGETGKGNYIAKSKEAIEQYNIQCKIFIIGIAQNKEQEEKSRELAKYTQGVFINITSSNYDPNRIKAQLTPIKTAIVQDTIEIKSLNQKIETTSEQINDNLLEQKLIQIKQESDKSGFANNVEELIQKIKSQLEISQGLLNEVQELKRQIESFDFCNIRSTTLSIDPAYSEEIRQKSELYAFDILKNRHPNKIIVWLNENGESYANHDFEIQDDTGNIENVIECKGTPLDRKTFYLTDSEWDYFRGLKEIYQVIRVFNLNQNTDHLIIENLYDSLMTGKVVPYLLEPEILKEKRVYLTIN